MIESEKTLCKADFSKYLVKFIKGDRLHSSNQESENKEIMELALRLYIEENNFNRRFSFLQDINSGSSNCYLFKDTLNDKTVFVKETIEINKS